MLSRRTRAVATLDYTSRGKGYTLRWVRGREPNGTSALPAASAAFLYPHTDVQTSHLWSSACVFGFVSPRQRSVGAVSRSQAAVNGNNLMFDTGTQQNKHLFNYIHYEQD